MMLWDSLDRKALVPTLCTAGLGLGLIVATTGGTPGASAQETSTPVVARGESGSGEGDVRVRLRSDEMREELYAEFTAALADELGIANADEVDAAIRIAMKVLIATSDVPLGPGPMFGPPPGASFRGGLGFGEEGRFHPIRGGEENWIIRADNGSRADEGVDHEARSNAKDNSGANEDDADGESS
jgi:hypothetical protein